MIGILPARIRMLHTKQIDTKKTSGYLEQLDRSDDISFRGAVIKALGDEVIFHTPKPESTYYVIYRDKKDLLLVRTTPLPRQSMAISFCKIFDREQKGKHEAHLWLKNALEEKIIPNCINREIITVKARAVTDSGRKVLESLSKLKINGARKMSFNNSFFELTCTFFAGAGL